MNTLGENIKKYRLKSKLTQEELASRLGKSKNVISNWERGDNKPDADIIEEICLIFNISPNQIYGWEKQPQTIAAHFDGDTYTEDELQRIEEYKQLLLAARNNKK